METRTARFVTVCDARVTGSLDEFRQRRRRSGLSGSPRKRSRREWLRICESLVAAYFLDNQLPSDARIPTDTLPRSNLPPPPPRRPPPPERDVKEDVLRVEDLTHRAEQASSEGQFQRALEFYTEIVESYPDLAVTEYARLHRALLLYQLEDVRGSLLELDDLEVSLRGLAEVHAALAALIYVERPLQLSRAEEQWELATAFDKRYNDTQWVDRTKKWPPRMLQALERFLELR